MSILDDMSEIEDEATDENAKKEKILDSGQSLVKGIVWGIMAYIKKIKSEKIGYPFIDNDNAFELVEILKRIINELKSLFESYPDYMDMMVEFYKKILHLIEKIESETQSDQK